MECEKGSNNSSSSPNLREVESKVENWGKEMLMKEFQSFALKLKKIVNLEPEKCSKCSNTIFTLTTFKRAKGLFSLSYVCSRYACHYGLNINKSIPDVKQIDYFFLFFIMAYLKNHSLANFKTEISAEKFEIDYPIKEVISHISSVLKVKICKYLFDISKNCNFGKGKEFTYYFSKYALSEEKDMYICRMDDKLMNCSKYFIMNRKGQFDITCFFENIDQVEVKAPDQLEFTGLDLEWNKISDYMSICNDRIEQENDFVFCFYEALFRRSICDKRKNEKLKIISHILENYSYSETDLTSFEIYENIPLQESH